MQATPHAVPLHVAVPFAGAGHAVHDVAPQLVTALFDTQAVPQRWKPAAQLVPQRPAVQVATEPAGAGHTVPHAPQWFTSVRVFTQAEPQRVGAVGPHPEVHA